MPIRNAATFLLLSSLVACSGEVAKLGAGIDSESGSGGDSTDAGSSAAFPVSGGGAGGGAGASDEPDTGGTAGGSAVGYAGSPAGGFSVATGGAASIPGTAGTAGLSPTHMNPPSNGCTTTEMVAAEDASLSSNAASEEECDMIAAAQLDSKRQAENKELEVAPLAGTWLDEADERVELVLDATGRGSYLVGDDEELPAIDDPYEPYLSSQGPEQIDPGRDERPIGARRNFRYRVYPESGRASEMTFRYRNSEPWDEWCALQTPIRGDQCYACELALQGGRGGSWLDDGCGTGPGCFTSNDANQMVQLHCGRAALCGSIFGVCTCSSEECWGTTIDSSGSVTVTLDPVDTNVLRLVDPNSGFSTRYLVRTPTN